MMIHEVRGAAHWRDRPDPPLDGEPGQGEYETPSLFGRLWLRLETSPAL